MVKAAWATWRARAEPSLAGSGEQRTERGWLALVVGATVALGVAYIVLVPPGLPYDEPSHWFNVEFYRTNHRMPVIDEGMATYEAQMGPVAYVLAALVASPFASTEDAFYAVRAMGLLQLLALVVVVWRLVGKAFPGHPRAAVLAAAAAGLNPMLLVVSTSVQNDVVALLLAAIAIDLASPLHAQHRDAPPLARSFWVGVVVGLALLAKVSVWPVAVVLVPWIVWRAGWGSAVLYCGSAASVSAWWFGRNLRLYGDLTGKAGVDAAGYDFPPLGWQPAELLREAVTTLWIPVEYLRNTISAPAGVEALVGSLTVAAALGLVLTWRRAESVHRLLMAVAAVGVAGWVVVAVSVQAVSFRIAFPALLGWFAGVGALAMLRASRLAFAVILVGLAGLNLWLLLELAAMEDPGLLQLAAGA